MGAIREAAGTSPRRCAAPDCHVVDETGIVFDPLAGKWQEGSDMAVDSIMAAERKD